MLSYLLDSGACLIVFFLFYRVFLERENLHYFKRGYLLFAMVISFITPMVTFTTFKEVNTPIVSSTTGEFNTFLPSTEGAITYDYGLDLLPALLWSIYGLGVIIFSLRFAVNLIKIVHRIRVSNKVLKRRIVDVLVAESVIPHTFFNYIFYSLKEYQSGKIADEIKWHEEIHARQLHSFDVLFAELIQIVFWFNPIVYFFKTSIKLNHEFLADQGVLKKGARTAKYQDLILTLSTQDHVNSLVNTFNYSHLKQRFIIMKTQTTKLKVAFIGALLIPVVVLTLFSFSKREVILKHQESNAREQVVKPEPENIVSAYNTLARHYNTYPAYDFVTKAKDMYTIWQLYSQMTDEQRAKALPYQRSTTSMTITITNDGKFLDSDQKETSIASIEAMLKRLTPEERSEAYAFSDEFDVGKYVRYNKERNMSQYTLNHIYIHVRSEEFVPGKVINKDVKEWKAFDSTLKLATPARLNKKLDSHVDQLHDMLKEYGVKVTY
ncbi:MAG: M56 family metallopeptidase [Bacteroidota bacterium]